MTSPAALLTGPVDLKAVDDLVARPVSELSAAELQLRIAQVTREHHRVEGWLSVASAELDARTGGLLPEPAGDPDRPPTFRKVVGWLAEASRVGASAAGSALRVAELLRGLPLMEAAVLDARLTLQQARILIRLCGKINAQALIEQQGHLIEVAAPLTPADLTAWVSNLIATHCEPALDADERTAQAKRYLTHRREDDGSLFLRCRLPAGDAEALLTALEPLARATGLDDNRTSGQRRADALTDLVEQVLRHGDLPDAGGRRAQLSYVLPADWAARHHDRDTCPDCTPCPDHQPAHAPSSFGASVHAALPDGCDDHGGCDSQRHRVVPAAHACASGAWTGPQTRGRIEALLCDARITRVLLDAFGQVTGLETLTDSITPAQRRALAARDLGCAVRGCTRPPAVCDAHHLVHREDDGDTTMANLVLLCRRHHVLWHNGRLTLRQIHVPWLTHTGHHSTGPPGPSG